MKTTKDIGGVIPGALLMSAPAKRYQVRHWHTGRVLGWRNSIVGARLLAGQHGRILDHHSAHADGTPAEAV